MSNKKSKKKSQVRCLQTLPVRTHLAVDDLASPLFCTEFARQLEALKARRWICNSQLADDVQEVLLKNQHLWRDELRFVSSFLDTYHLMDKEIAVSSFLLADPLLSAVASVEWLWKMEAGNLPIDLLPVAPSAEEVGEVSASLMFLTGVLTAFRESGLYDQACAA